MKYVIAIVMLMTLLIFGCSSQEAVQSTEVEQKVNNSAVASTCNSLCEIDAKEYCEAERTIVINEVKVTGTCRAFSQKGTVPEFERCMGFCKEFDQAGTNCKVNGQVDSNCDGQI